MKKYPISDSKLVSLFQGGSERAFEELVHRHKARIYTAIYFVGKDSVLATFEWTLS